MPNRVVQIETTNGTFQAEIFEDATPETAAHFLDLVAHDFYKYTPVNLRRGVAMELGRPAETAPGHSTYMGPNGVERTRDANGCVPDEFVGEKSNEMYTLALANAGLPNTGSSQFFVNLADNSFFDYWDDRSPDKHVVFGRITQGFEHFTEDFQYCLCHKIL
ncbi:Peptidyl-prolyl cis-trans isomerase-like 1 [Diplonema papillatum]|nr:Peptidyl-prolyl cis-trans isomerase-like 1 [Diplonema papillatum]